ncbi:MAG: hypothetical protein KGL39_14890 [Patescibacteria group bacterium]|nr:hypothetical protein [Patescibacteria group bacterium]
MAKLEDRWACEMCGATFVKPMDVRDEVMIVNGANSRAWAYVCEACIKRTVQVLDEAFPENKYAVRERMKPQMTVGR